MIWLLQYSGMAVKHLIQACGTFYGGCTVIHQPIKIPSLPTPNEYVSYAVTAINGMSQNPKIGYSRLSRLIVPIPP